MWGIYHQLKELREENTKLRAWQALALDVLTDDQLDFLPASGKTLRRRFSEIENTRQDPPTPRGRDQICSRAGLGE